MNNVNRFWELDFLRGIAIVGMIFFHLMFNLQFFLNSGINVDSLPWIIFARSVAITFILLVGVCAAISYEKNSNKIGIKKTQMKLIKRSLQIFFCALLVSFFTYLFFPNVFVIFGILHFISLSLILSIPFLRFKYLNVFFALIIIITGLSLKKYTFDTPWLLFMGLMPENFSTLDYFPLLPWFGILLMGIYLSKMLYKKNQRLFLLRDLSDNPFVDKIGFLGKHSLLIYLVHEPILVFALYLNF